MSDENRKYSDEQLALILRRASDLQAQRDQGRHSLAEIQEIARQVGIDPALIAHVAAGLPSREPNNPVSASSLVHTMETVLPQRVSSEQMGRLVDAVRRASGAQGTSRQVFDSVEWRWGSEHEIVDVRVTITPGAERTNVRVHHDASGAGVLSGIVAIVPIFIGASIAFTVLPVAAGAAVTAGIVGAAGAGVVAFRRYIQRRGAAIVERIATAVSDEADVQG